MKLFSQANRIDASILALPFPGGNTGGPLTFGGIGSPIFGCANTQTGGGPYPYGVDAGYNIVNQKYIDVVTASKNGANSYIAEIDTASGGTPTILAGGILGHFDNLLGCNTGSGYETAAADVSLAVVARNPGGGYGPIAATIFTGATTAVSLGYVIARTRSGMPFYCNGQDYLVMGYDGTGASGRALLGNLSGFISTPIWNGLETGISFPTNSFSSWTNRQFNYILINGRASSTGRCYIVKCDTTGNEISRNYLAASDPIIDTYFTTNSFFTPCDKGFMAFIYDPSYMNGILLVAPDGLSYTIYECGALDLTTADDFTGAAGWGSTQSVYIDANDVVYVATNTAWFPPPATSNSIYVSLADRNPSMYAQPLGPCWPCLPTARGIA